MTPSTSAEIVQFMRQSKYAVVASCSRDGSPQAAVVGIVVSEALEVFFDTLGGSRKIANLRDDPRVALVMWVGERTVQYEGIADEPSGAELDRLRELYFETFPDGRERAGWPDITYVRARPHWIRSSDFGTDPPKIFELSAGADGVLRGPSA
jgi:hypothetical protein